MLEARIRPLRIDEKNKCCIVALSDVFLTTAFLVAEELLSGAEAGVMLAVKSPLCVVAAPTCE